MKITNSTTSFTGYSNVLAKIKTDKRLNTYFITAQLNDAGIKDLTEFKNLKQAINTAANNNNNNLNVNSDIITVTYKFSDSKDTEILTIDNVGLCMASELKRTKKKCIKNNNYDLYTLIEQLNLKAYTFLAGLTKRISNDNNIRQFDVTNEQHISSIKTILKERFCNEDKANEAITALLLGKQASSREVSAKINKAIDNTMRDYFDVA